MSEQKSSTYPYTLEVEANPRAPGTYQWVIRKNGTMVQRSDRAQASAANAWVQGTEMIEKLIHGGGEERR
jgi:hypothetical protein